MTFGELPFGELTFGEFTFGEMTFGQFTFGEWRQNRKSFRTNALVQRSNAQLSNVNRSSAQRSTYYVTARIISPLKFSIFRHYFIFFDLQLCHHTRASLPRDCSLIFMNLLQVAES